VTPPDLRELNLKILVAEYNKKMDLVGRTPQTTGKTSPSNCQTLLDPIWTKVTSVVYP
jgi:hypothetical protein